MHKSVSISATSDSSRPIVRGGPLDALRFVAALFVVIFHFGSTAPVNLRELHPIWDRGYLATDFFLLLSGFVLARAYGKVLLAGQLTPWRFWIKRFWRGYPTHIITLALLVILVLAATAIGSPPDHPERFPLSGIPAQIFLLQAFGFGGSEWNIPAWTLSVLLLCYAFLPWTWRAISKVPTATAAIGLALLIMAVSQYISLQVLDHSVFNLPAQWATFRCLPMYLSGLLVARAVETAQWPAPTFRLLALGGCLVLLADALWISSDLLAAYAICVLTLGFGGLLVTKPLPGAAWGAQISFCLFMTHTLTGAVLFAGAIPVLAKFAPGLLSGPAGWTLWLGTLVIAIIVAHLFDRLIDAPIQRYIRKRWF